MTGYAPAFEMTAQQQLGAVLDKLHGRDREFAESLLRQAKAYQLSEKQAPWVQKLIDKANGTDAKPRRAGVAIGDLTPVIALMEKGGKKFPKILMRCGDVTLQLTVAGPRSNMPGAINVATEGGYGNNTWYGRITRDGAFQPSREELPGLVEALRDFAANPAKVAGEYGLATHHCCFCTLDLTDERSKEVGYGPICAGRYGLPWGVK